MRKLAWMLLLVLSSPALAAWKSVAEDARAITYVDPGSLRKNGDLVALASLVDYREFQRMVEVGYYSQKTEAEYDCRKRQARNLALHLHEGRMGAGKVIYEDASPHDWEDVQPETPVEVLWKVACGR